MDTAKIVKKTKTNHLLLGMLRLLLPPGSPDPLRGAVASHLPTQLAPNMDDASAASAAAASTV